MLTVDPNDESITIVYLIDERIEAKKYDRYGYPMWGGNEVVLVDTPGTAWVRHWAYPDGQWGQVISDDSGGAVICWEDFRNAPLHPFTFEPEGSEVFIQRVDVNGQVRYGTNGKKISGPATDGFRLLGDMKKDYNGGFVLGYMGDSTSTSAFLKRFLLNGTLDWYKYFADGYLLDVDATDTSGNIFIGYGSYFSPNNKRHKIDINGNFLWSDSLFGRIPGDISFRHGGAFTDGEGGVIGVGPSGYLKINRVDSSGQYVFGENGIDLGGGQFGKIGYATDNAGGIYVSWKDSTVKVQRVTNSGILRFNNGGLSPCINPDCSNSGEIASDNESGIISIWVVDSSGIRPLLAQRIDSTGNLVWNNGKPVKILNHLNETWTWPAVPIYSDGRGGVIYLLNELSGGMFIQQISKNGNIGEIDSATQIINPKDIKFPIQCTLEQNTPNPFNSSTRINYHIPNSGNVKINVYNILGQLVKTIIDKKVSKGFHSLIWYGKNEYEKSVATGVYFYRIETDDFVKTKKMIYMR